LTQWAEIVKACNNSGLSIREYCRQNDINSNAYFYWLRKLREAAIESSGGGFAELVAPPVEPTVDCCEQHGVVVEVNGVRIHVEDAACRATLAMVLEVLGNAQ
jgi:hypothetical protein